MALPTPECFKSLDWLDKYAAIYEALIEASGAEDLESPVCFKAEDQRTQLTNIYAAVLQLTQ